MQLVLQIHTLQSHNNVAIKLQLSEECEEVNASTFLNGYSVTE